MKVSMSFLKFLMIFTVAVIFSPVALSSEVYSIEEWAKRADMSNVALSPEGDKLALLKIPTKDGNPILEIYNANNLSGRPFKMNADPMEITSFSWTSNDQILFSARMKVRDKIDDFNRGVYEYKGGLLTLDPKSRKKSKWKSVGNVAGVMSTLPKSPDKILIYSYEDNASRYPTYYKFDIKKKTRQLITRESPKVSNFRFDADGDPRFGLGRDSRTDEWLTYYRAKESSDWKVINRSSEDSFEEWSVAGFDPALEGNLLVLAHNGNDKIGLWSFDPETLQYEELIYRRSDVDLLAVGRHSNVHTNPDEIVSVAYFSGRELKREYFDGNEQAVYEQLKMWDDSLSPIKEVAKVNVPMLIVHGDVDQRTPPRAARTYIEALQENGKNFKSLWLEGADHFSNTLFYHHKLKFYGALTDYLENDCFGDKQSLAAN